MPLQRAATTSHGTLTDVTADQHQARQHALDAAADHTGEISDAQHGTRGIASPHAHSTLASLGSPYTDHTTLTALEFAHIALFGG